MRLYPKGGGISSPDRASGDIKERTYGHESRLDTTLRLYPKKGRRILTGPGRVTGPAWIQHMRLYPKGGGVSSPDRAIEGHEWGVGSGRATRDV